MLCLMGRAAVGARSVRGKLWLSLEGHGKLELGSILDFLNCWYLGLWREVEF